MLFQKELLKELVSEDTSPGEAGFSLPIVLVSRCPLIEGLYTAGYGTDD